jgi:membrane-bound lytic murein transglycosylase D
MSSVARKYSTKPDVIRELNDLPSGALTIGTDLRVPSEAVTLPPKVVLAAARVDGRRGAVARGRQHVHVVRRGDTLWAVARSTGIDVRTLATMNGMNPGDTLRAGQKLKLTAAAPSASRTKLTSASSEGTAGGERPVTYIVRAGDSLYAIAKLFQVTVAQITSWNDITSRSAIKPGQKLTIRVSSRRG